VLGGGDVRKEELIVVFFKVVVAPFQLVAQLMLFLLLFLLINQLLLEGPAPLDRYKLAALALHVDLYLLVLKGVNPLGNIIKF
jgi:hypothetical protein